VPFIIVIKNKKKHMERFAVRSRYMTLDPNLNRYIAYLHNIRTIQNNFIVKADEALIPKIDNGNIDRSVGVMHSVIIRCLRKINKS